MGQEMSIILEAREIVRSQPMSVRVGHLRKCADDLHEQYDVLCISLTRAAATNFVAALSRTLLAIEQVHASTPTSPQGGALRVPKVDKPAESEQALV